MTLVEENAKLKAQVATLQVERAATRAAEQRGDLHSPISAATVILDRLKYNADMRVVEGKDGRPISAHLEDLVQVAPYFVKPPGEKETAVQPEGKYPLPKIFGKGSDAKLAMELFKTDPDRYRAMRIAAKAAKLF